MKPTLLILAAGMGSRYGGMKQLDRVGPSGETIMDYSVYDAIRAGFGKVVFVIRKGFEKEFQEQVVQPILPYIDVELAFQETESLPDDFVCPENRTKPWGTGHAVWVTRNQIAEPFAVINADDFYGREAFVTIASFLQACSPKEHGKYAMCGYRLKNTLSEHGQVSRGVCKADEHNMLTSVTEYKAIERADDGTILSNGEPAGLHPDDIVSMNFWGFCPDIFQHLDEKLTHFLNDHLNDQGAEFFIPFAVDELIRDNKASVTILPNNAKWFGVTYKADKEKAEEILREMTANGAYPERLW